MLFFVLVTFEFSAKVSNMSGAGNGHFRDFKQQQTMLERQKKNSIFYWKCNPESLSTATTLAGQQYKKNENAQKFV